MRQMEINYTIAVTIQIVVEAPEDAVEDSVTLDAILATKDLLHDHLGLDDQIVEAVQDATELPVLSMSLITD